MTRPFAVRRVVAAQDADGRPVFVSDGPPPLSVAAPTGHGVAELWWADAPPERPGDGGEPAPSALGAFPAGGAVAARVVRLPGVPDGTPPDRAWLPMPGADPDRPGMHRSDTLDLMVVLDGRIVLGLDDGEYGLGPGDTVVQRATTHRWRVPDASPVTYLTVLLSLDEAEAAAMTAPDEPAAAPGPGPLVTGTGRDGASLVWQASTGAEPARPEPEFRDLWRTDGTTFARLDLAPGGVVTAGDPDEIRVAVVVAGTVELALSAGPSTTLHPCDVAVLRGVAHTWRASDGIPAVVVATAFATTPATTPVPAPTPTPVPATTSATRGPVPPAP
ncbi:hypothetical protein [Yinghuangia seranimata]|uniref:hypothetical protein n=1 Tax=Yinghuangia seranimata TaxID=408067 RepID=UPI00248C11F7|nr:hypothetical protein [Yinghuangia seranimata]MDI2131615.1 hypothetical protein [Yinghuangia seranimata]